MGASTEVAEPEIQEQVQVWRPRVKLLVVALKIVRLVRPAPPFSNSLLESAGFEKRRRTLATAISFVFQCSLIGVLLILPLMFTEALPKQQLLTFLVAPPPLPPPPPSAAEAVTKVVRVIQSDIRSGQLRSPSQIPERVQMIREEEAPPPLASIGGVVGGVPGGIPGGQSGGVIGSIINSTSSMAVVPKLAVARGIKTRPHFPGCNKGAADSEDRTQIFASGAAGTYQGTGSTQSNHWQGW
jgi:hypothetical protein